MPGRSISRLPVQLLEALLPKGKPALARWFALAIARQACVFKVLDSRQGGPRPQLSSPMCPGCRRWAFASRLRPTASAWCWCCSRVGGRGGRFVQLEHRAADQRVFCLLSRPDRRRLRRLSQLRLFLLFVFYEIAIVPKYFLIAIWGSTRREYGAMKLALYSFVGSAMVLIGLLAAYTATGSHRRGSVELAHAGLPVSFQMWAFPLVFVGFGILAGMWPSIHGRLLATLPRLPRHRCCWRAW